MQLAAEEMDFERVGCERDTVAAGDSHMARRHV